MSSSSSSDHKEQGEQLRAIQNNDEKVLEVLYKENYPKTEKYVLQNNGTAEQARDIFQEAFIALWRNIQLKKFVLQEGKSIEAYLFQIAKNKWLDHLRSAGYKRTTELKAQHDNAIEMDMATGINEKEIQQVKENFAQLGGNCKELLRRFYFQKQSLRTIAESMSWTEATAKNNKYRCIERLRNLMKTNKTNP